MATTTAYSFLNKMGVPLQCAAARSEGLLAWFPVLSSSDFFRLSKNMYDAQPETIELLRYRIVEDSA